MTQQTDPLSFTTHRIKLPTLPICVRSRGFTLLELLISLSLSVMVLITLASGLYLLTQDWQRTGNRLEHGVDDGLIMLQLERALEGAFPYTYLVRDKNQRFIFFEGDAEQVRWVSTVAPGQSSQLSLWHLQPGEEGNGLNLAVIPALAGDPTERLEATDGVQILSDYRVRFEYALVQEVAGEQEVEWVKEWSMLDWEADRGQPRMPNGVRIVFEHREESELTTEILAPVWVNEP